MVNKEYTKLTLGAKGFQMVFYGNTNTNMITL